MIWYTEYMEYFPLALSILGGVVWAVRLEGRLGNSLELIKINQVDIDTLRTKHEALDSKVLEKISQIQQTVARIEGMLESRNVNIS